MLITGCLALTWLFLGRGPGPNAVRSVVVIDGVRHDREVEDRVLSPVAQSDAASDLAPSPKK